MKKLLRYAGIAVLIAAVGFLFYLLFAFLGNPISVFLAKNAAKEHLAANYADTDFEIEDVKYSFKTGYYHASIVSPSSDDTYFSLSFNNWGKLNWDSYEDTVANGWNTWDRLNNAYRELTDPVMLSKSFPYRCTIGYGELAVNDGLEADMPRKMIGLELNTLVLDQEYDIAELGAKHGRITIHIADNYLSAERAGVILLDVKKAFDEAGVPFQAVDFVLTLSQGVDGPYIWLFDFLYSDIYEEGLVERIEESNDLSHAYFDTLDAAGDKAA